MNTKYQAAAGRDRAAPGLGRAWPAAAWHFVFILDSLDIYWLYLDISWTYFWYFIGMCLYFWYTLSSDWQSVNGNMRTTYRK